MIIMYCLIKRDLKDNVINIVDSVFESEQIPRMLIPILKQNRALLVCQQSGIVKHDPANISQKEGKYLVVLDETHKKYQLGTVSNCGYVFDRFVFEPTIEYSVVQYEYDETRGEEDIDVDKTLEELRQK